MPLSPTPDWKLKCFSWLDLDRWTPNALFNIGDNEGKRYCKVCDSWVKGDEASLEAHVAVHIKEETARQAKVKALAAAEREKEKEFARQEKEALKGTPADPRPSKPAKAPRNSSRPRAPRQDRSGAVPLLEQALTNLGEATAVALSEATGLEIGVVRGQIKKVPGIKIVGEVKSGGRGRPASIYGLAKSTNKEG